MCFSAQASFLAAGVLLSLGMATLRQRPSRIALPFALIPIIFALQQTGEGLLWLFLPSGNHPFLIPFAHYAFLIPALVIWPLWIPFSLYVLMPKLAKSVFFAFCALCGAAFSLFALGNILLYGSTAEIQSCHLSYAIEGLRINTDIALTLYCFATIIPFFLPTKKALFTMALDLRSPAFLPILFGIPILCLYGAFLQQY